MNQWKNYLRIIVAGLSLSCNGLPALANFAMSPSGSTTAFAIDAVNQGTLLCAAANTECPASVPINTAGSPLFITATPGIVAGAGTLGTPGGGVVTVQGGSGGTNLPVSQATAANLNATVVGTGTFAVQAGLNAGTNIVGKVGIDQTTPGTTNGVQVNAALPAGTNLMGKVGIDQTTVGTTNGVSLAQIGATTVATGNGVSGAGSQRVNIASDNTAFAVNATLQASATTAIGKVDPNTIATWGLVAQGGATAPTNAAVAGLTYNSTPITLTNGQSAALQGDANGYLNVHVQAGGGTGGTSITDNAAFTTGTTPETPIGCYAGTPSATANHSTIVSCTAAGSVHTTVDNANANGQQAMAASSPVVLASNQSVGDPCTFQTKTNVPISTASGTLALVTGVSAKKVYICSLSLIAAAAVAVSIAEGSGTTCGTSAQAGILGVATNGTAANGLSLAANGGLTLGNGGGTVAQSATAANYVCLFQSGTVQIAGNISYVQQ